MKAVIDWRPSLFGLTGNWLCRILDEGDMAEACLADLPACEALARSHRLTPTYTARAEEARAQLKEHTRV